MLHLPTFSFILSYRSLTALLFSYVVHACVYKELGIVSPCILPVLPVNRYCTGRTGHLYT